MLANDHSRYLYNSKGTTFASALRERTRGQALCCTPLLTQSDEKTVERPRWSQAMSFVILCLANLSFLPGFSATRNALHRESIYRFFHPALIKVVSCHKMKELNTIFANQRPIFNVPNTVSLEPFYMDQLLLLLHIEWLTIY